MKQNIDMSDVITIDTEDNRCALAFGFELLKHIEDAQMLVLTANDLQLVHDNLQQVKQFLPGFEALHTHTKYLFLKDSWSNLDTQYGSTAFKNELISLVENNHYDVYYFHRIDLFFDKIFTPQIQEAIIACIDAVRYQHKKVFFSYNTKTVSGKSFDSIFEKRRDLSFDVNINEYNNCNQTMKTHNKLLKKPYATIHLISDQEDMIAFHKQIFMNQPDIHFSALSLEDLQRNPLPLSDEADLIIYNDSRKVLDKAMIDAFHTIAPLTQIFLLSHKKFLRKSDYITAKETGIDHIQPKSFDTRDYIYEIEQLIHNHFYTQKLENISFLGKSQNVSLNELMQRVSELEKKNILFSLVTISKSDICTDELIAMIRKEDFIYIDKTHSIILFVLVNLLPDAAKQIIAERTHVNKMLVKPYKKDTLAQLIH